MPTPVEQCCVLAAVFYLRAKPKLEHTITHYGNDTPEDGMWVKGRWYIANRLFCCEAAHRQTNLVFAELAHTATWEHARARSGCKHKGVMKQALVIAALREDT